MLLLCLPLLFLYYSLRSHLQAHVLPGLWDHLQVIQTDRASANQQLFCGVNICLFVLAELWIGATVPVFGASSAVLSLLYTAQYVHHGQAMYFQPRNDLSQTLWVHHILTIILLTSSWWSGYHHIGGFIMYIHDISDIPVHLVRLVRYCHFHGSQADVLQMLIMPVLLIAWFYYRIFVFGDFIYSISDQIWFFLPLTGLWSLHVYWFGLMVQKSAQFLMS